MDGGDGGSNSPFRIEKRDHGNYIIRHPANEDDHKYSLVWLHGLGDSAEGMIDFFLDPNVLPLTTKVILPTAPERPVTCNMGFPSTSWYDIKQLGY